MHRCGDGAELRGRIVETEAYLGGEDKASHSAGGKRTERNTAMFMKPGTIYVYPIYGIYLCMNVSSEGKICLIHFVMPVMHKLVIKPVFGFNCLPLNSCGYYNIKPIQQFSNKWQKEGD